MIYCGIAAFNGKKNLTKSQKEKVYNNMKILGLYNQERGGDGCGMFLNGNLYKGYSNFTTKKDTTMFRNFISDEEHKNLEYKDGSILIHSRKAAGGGVCSRENNHPFFIDSQTNPFFIVHNGVISNIRSLATKHELPLNSFEVDSHGLGLLLEKVGMNILKEYDGYAALLWVMKNNPEEMFVYHGKYCKYKEDKIEEAIEERPLYFLKSKEGIYLSSMENSLITIAAKNEIVECLNHNYVFKLKNGEFEDFSFEIDRVYGPNTIEKPVIKFNNNYQQTSNWNNNRNYGHSWEDDYVDDYGYNNYWNKKAAENNTKKSTEIILSNSSSNNTINIDRTILYSEPEPTQASTIRRIFFHKGRYKAKFQINSSGKSEASLLHGSVHHDKKGNILDSGIFHSNKEISYFIQGVMIKTESFKEASNWYTSYNTNNFGKTNFAFSISKWSKHPVTNYVAESPGIDDQLLYAWYCDGKRIISPKNVSFKFSSRLYTINSNGYLEKISNTTKSNNDEKIDVNLNKFSDKTKANSLYDVVFYSVKDAYKMLSTEELLAIRFFIFDCLVHESKNNDTINDIYNYTNEDFLKEVASTINDAVASQRSIRSVLEDTLHALETFESKKIRKEYLEAIVFLDKKNPKYLNLCAILNVIEEPANLFSKTELTIAKKLEETEKTDETFSIDEEKFSEEIEDALWENAEIYDEIVSALIYLEDCITPIFESPSASEELVMLARYIDKKIVEMQNELHMAQLNENA